MKNATSSEERVARQPLEVHRHSFLGGGHYNRKGVGVTELVHSHEGGDRMHQHEGYGPGTYVIDRDEWRRKTGLRGGGKKKFTNQPSGDQLPITECEDWQKSFEVIIAGEPSSEIGTGPGEALPIRIALASKMTFTVRDDRKRRA